MVDDHTLLSTGEAAEYAGVSVDVITAWRVRGIVPASKVGSRWQFAPADLDATLERRDAGDVVPRWRANPQRAGSRLRAFREAAGLSQRALAAACDLCAAQVMKLEQGAAVPHAATIRRLADALDVTPDGFVRDDPLLAMDEVTTRDAAILVGVHPRTVRCWLTDGALPGRKVGAEWRIPQQAVIDLIHSDRLRGSSRRLMRRPRRRA